MNEIKMFTNEELGIQVRTIMNEDASISINAEDTAIGFGWTQTQSKGGKEYTSIRWETLNGYCSDLDFPNKLGKDDYIPESLFYMLGMKASNERALKYQKWIAMDILPSIRKTGSYITPENKPKCIEDVLIESLQEMKSMKERLNAQDNKIESIKEVISLDTTSWRNDTGNILRKIGVELGSGQAFSQVRSESYELLNKRMGVDLQTRLTNKRRRMADNGVCKSTRDKLSYVDIIAEDKKLIEGYTAIVKEMAIKYGVA
ncbi:MAG: hypothetical protein ACK5JH_13870 [Anaerocolumna sp.]